MTPPSNLPYQLPTNVGWQFVQITHDNLTTPVSTLDTTEADLDQVPSGELWVISRIAVSCLLTGFDPSDMLPAPSILTLYRSNISPSAVEDFTFSGAGDVFEAGEPITLNESDVLRLVWSQTTQGATGYAHITRAVYRRSS